MLPWLMALSIGAMLLGVAVLFFSITRILRLLRESELARVPAASEAEVTMFYHVEHSLYPAVPPDLGALKVF